MLQQINELTVPEISQVTNASPATIVEKNFSRLLDAHHLDYRKEEYYLQVGEIDWTQGWIIDLSVLPHQFVELFNKIIPLLLYEKKPFKMAQNLKTARSITGGELGYLAMGKSVSIYPANEVQALQVAKKLIELTGAFRGPRILTDRHLGTIVYTRYGACKPVIRVDAHGREEACIYAAGGTLINDPYSIPFVLPEGIDWPFSELVPAKEPKKETVLQDKYKPIKILKEDMKGAVKKGLYLEKWYRIKWCVIKEGKENMIADDHGRDVGDRLRWQYDLHKRLEEVIPLPKIYDLFVENGDTYLVMEYIKGPSLDTIIYDTRKDRPWNDLSLTNRLRLIDLGMQVLAMIGQMHAKGYIHRDITPANFIVGKGDGLCMIDLELSYSEDLETPSPPFRLGTPGFMSPEQALSQKPTVQQDIYSLGALLITLLTALPADRFSLDKKEILRAQLFFFLQNRPLVEMLSQCFQTEPNLRPSLFELRSALQQFREAQDPIPLSSPEMAIENINKQSLRAAIQSAIQALSSSDMMNTENLWLSKTIQEPGFVYQQMEGYSVYADFYKGVSGVVWLLARAKKLGFSVNNCNDGVEKSRLFIQEYASERTGQLPAGLFIGTAGITCALLEGIENHLIPDDEHVREEIRGYLGKDIGHEINFAHGISGQGMMLIKARSFLEDSIINTLLGEILNHLLCTQQEDGSWVIPSLNSKKPIKATGIGNGVAGIVLFLLEYCKQTRHQDTSVIRSAAGKALNWLTTQVSNTGQHPFWAVHNRTKSYSPGLQDGTAGVILSLIKGYELLGEERYRQLAEKGLNSYPVDSINRDITLSTGLIGYAETCLEASLGFQNTEWEKRAHRVADYLLHCYREQENGGKYWVTKGRIATAGLMEGNAGVIHFLLRCYEPCKLNHPYIVV